MKVRAFRITAVIAVVAIGTFVFPVALPNLGAMVANLAAVAKMTPEERALFGVPHAGENVLPVPVQFALAFLREGGAADFRLSAAWAADDLLSQRITEAAFPILRNESSGNLLGMVEEIPQTCRIARTSGPINGTSHVVALGICN